VDGTEDGSLNRYWSGREKTRVVSMVVVETGMLTVTGQDTAWSFRIRDHPRHGLTLTCRGEMGPFSIKTADVKYDLGFTN
jgi:uncharacterized protein (DUF1684 family)